MVNTFMVSYRRASSSINHDRYRPDYNSSARLLDKVRCNKQIIEAHQILNNLIYVRIIAQYLNYPESHPPFLSVDPQEIERGPEFIAQSFLDRSRWYHSVIQRYRSGSERLVLNQETQTYSIYPRTEAKKSNFPVHHKIINLGFANHPVSYMWFGYEWALQDYINAHIRSWTSRLRKDGTHCQTKYKIEDLPEQYPHPWWLICTSQVVKSHQASLLRKEYLRQEPPHYWEIDSFVQIPPIYYHEVGYLWVNHLTYNQLVDLIKTDDLDPRSICEPLL